MGYYSRVNECNIVLPLGENVTQDDVLNVIGDFNDTCGYFFWCDALGRMYGQNDGKAYDFDSEIAAFFCTLNALCTKPAEGSFLLCGEDWDDIAYYEVRDNKVFKYKSQITKREGTEQEL